MFQVLVEAPLLPGPSRGTAMPASLAERYGGALEVALRPGRPTFVANFVESLDGLVALEPPFTSSSRISGSFEPDRFVMALVRALADVVLVGAGTVREAVGHEWTPRGISPEWAPACEAWRRELGLSPQPVTAVVSASGNVPLDHHGLTRPDVPVIVITTREGARRLADEGAGTRTGGPEVRVETVASPGGAPGVPAVAAAAVAETLRSAGARVVACEGGPHLMGDLLAEDMVDELFLTLAPQLLGRAPGKVRFGLVEGSPFTPPDAPWARLVSARRSGEHLFLRYALEGQRGPGRR